MLLMLLLLLFAYSGHNYYYDGNNAICLDIAELKVNEPANVRIRTSMTHGWLAFILIHWLLFKLVWKLASSLD